jgi:hydrogenase nickel incorporation protein HypB
MCDDCGCGVVSIEERVLARNDALAMANRDLLASRRVRAVNLMSSPGSGKTTLLERAIRDGRRPVSVIEGDQRTRLDAERIRRAGAPAVQINTGAGCHLDAAMIARAIQELDLVRDSLLVIENVGNLICPALFDLGEDASAVIVSVTEGADKPLKYPHMFRAADLVVINKVDLLPYVDFDLDVCRANIGVVNPSAAIMAVSATRGDGLAQWHDWLWSVRV